MPEVKHKMKKKIFLSLTLLTLLVVSSFAVYAAFADRLQKNYVGRVYDGIIPSNNEWVSEGVKCVFYGEYTIQGSPGTNDEIPQESTTETPSQSCYSTLGKCSGSYACVVNVSGNKVEWKSSCGGYATTILDGKNENAYFKCDITTPPTTFYRANWVCYDSLDIVASHKVPQTEKAWRQTANLVCKGRCSGTGKAKKCGVAGFSVGS